MSAETITLRRRATKDGGASLYLDIYQNGARRYEYLHLYLLPDSRQNRAKNAETLRLAETIRAKKILELQSGRYGIPAGSRDILLYDYFVRCLEKRKRQGGKRWHAWRSTLNTLRRFEPREGLFLHELDRAWCERWIEYLRHCEGERGGIIAQNTANTYNKVLRAMLNDAVKEGVLPSSPMATLKGVGAEETMREYLTAEEVRRLSSTSCRDNDVKRAFLFSCLTGLRRSDLTALRYTDLREGDGGRLRVELRQRKTKGLAYIDLTPDAVSLLGHPEDSPDGLVFHIPSPSNTARAVDAWVARAGIDKHITMHSARHTFATLLLTRGADLYTVSKLLGHRSITATQIYAKIVDEKRRAAVSLLEGIVTSNG